MPALHNTSPQIWGKGKGPQSGVCTAARTAEAQQKIGAVDEVREFFLGSTSVNLLTGVNKNLQCAGNTYTMLLVLFFFAKPIFILFICYFPLICFNLFMSNFSKVSKQKI